MRGAWTLNAYGDTASEHELYKTEVIHNYHVKFKSQVHIIDHIIEYRGSV